MGPHGVLLVDRMSLDTDMPMCLGKRYCSSSFLNDCSILQNKLNS